MTLGLNNANSQAGIMAARRDLQVAISRYKQVANQRPQTITQTGKVLVTIPPAVGSGSISAAEITTTVTFYNVYTDEPAFTFGSMVFPGQAVTSGSFPTVSGTVLSFTQPVQVDGVGAIQPYIGATVIFVVSGTPGLQIYCTYSFTGTGIMLPADAMPSNATGNA